MEPIPRIALCLNRGLLRDCLAAVLSECYPASCFVLDGGVESVAAAKGKSVDVLLAEAGLETGTILGLTQAIRRENHGARLILIASRRTPRHLLDLAAIGADGCIDEEASIEELEEAIGEVIQGKAYCSPQIANELFREMGRSGSKNEAQHRWAPYVDNVRLTPREREVLELIAFERLGNKQIARKLSISLYTVKNHVHNLIEKLGVEDRYEAAELAMKRRILATH